MFRINDLNARSAAICQELQANAEALDLKISDVAGARIIDFASDRIGTVESGIELARICLAGLATVEKIGTTIPDFALPFIRISTSNPIEACICVPIRRLAFFYRTFVRNVFRSCQIVPWARGNPEIS